MPTNPLHVEVSADSSDYTSSLSAAASRTDEFRDEVTKTSRRLDNLGEDATSASARIGGLSVSTSSAASAVAILGSAAAATTVAVGALSTAVVPLAAGLTAAAGAAASVAAGFGAVIGTGALAYGEQLASQNEKRLKQLNEKIARLKSVREETGSLTQAQQQQLKSLKETREEVKKTTSVLGALSAELEPAKEQLRESALAIGSEFIPLIRDAIDALPAFIRRIEDSLGNLQPFADALRDAGQVAFRVIPEMTERFMDLGRRALPALRDIGGFFVDTWRPALNAAVGVVAELSPEVRNLTGSLVDAAGPALRFGTSVLEVVIPALSALVDGITAVLKIANTYKADIKAALVGATETAIAAVDDLLKKIQEIGDQLGGPLGNAIENTASILRNSLTGDFKSAADEASELKTDLRQLKTELSTQLTPALKDASEAAKPLTSRFEDLDRETKAAGAAAVAAGGAFAGPLAKGIGGAVGGVAALAGKAAIAKGSLSGLGGAALRLGSLLTGPVGAAVAGLATAFAVDFGNIRSITRRSVGRVVKIFKRNLMPIFRELKTLVKRTITALKPLLDVLETIFTGTFKTIATYVEGSVDSVLSTVRVFLNILNGDFEEAFNILKGLVRRSLKRIQKIFKNIINTIINTVKEIGDIVGIITGALVDVKNWLVSSGKRIIKAGFNAIVNAAQNAVGYLTGTGDDSLYGDITGIIGDIGEWLTSTGQSIIRNAFDTVAGAVTSALTSIDLGPIDDAVQALINAAKTALSKLRAINNFELNLPQPLQTGFSFPDTSGVFPNSGGSSGGSSGSSSGGGSGNSSAPDFNDVVDQANDVVAPEVPTGSLEDISGIDTGGFIESTGRAIVHEGERVVPAAQVSDRGGVDAGTTVVIERIEASGRGEGRDAARALRDELDALDV